MTINTRKALISVGVILAILLVVYVMHDKFEKVEEEIDIGFSGEAQSNDLYASRLFLKAMGIPAEQVGIYELNELPSYNTVIIIDTRRGTLSDGRMTQLLNWVENGGHLITIGVRDNDQEDYLQSHLDVTIDKTHYLYSYDDEDKDKIKSVEPDYGDKNYAFDMSYFTPIESEASEEEKVWLDEKLFLINRNYGEGMVTLVANLTFADNRNIGKEDHAEFFWETVHRLHKAPANVWLLNDDDMPPLWKWIWQYAWQLVITLSLLLVFWLYTLTHRFGPVIPSESLNRRRILEHIRASGYFLWKQDQQALIESSRQQVFQKLGAIFPAWHQMTTQEQLQLASEYTEIPEAELQKVLFEQTRLSPDEFTRLMQQLEQIRK